jgi:hypothetical protein
MLLIFDFNCAVSLDSPVVPFGKPAGVAKGVKILDNKDFVLFSEDVFLFVVTLVFCEFVSNSFLVFNVKAI